LIDKSEDEDERGSKERKRRKPRRSDTSKFNYELIPNQSDLAREPLMKADKSYFPLVDKDFADGSCPIEPVPADREIIDSNERLLNDDFPYWRKQMADGGLTEGVVDPTSDLVFLQSLTTGRFRRVVNQGGRHLDMHASEGDADPESMEDVDPTTQLQESSALLTGIIATIFLIGQGLLAGLAVTHAYVINSDGCLREYVEDWESGCTPEDQEIHFLNAYCPVANEIRRTFFILTMLSFVSACDKYLREKSNRLVWEDRPPWQQWQVAYAVGAFFLTMLFTMLACDVDALMYHNHRADERWHKTAFADPDFRSMFDRWKVLSYLRMVFCLVAWIIVCIDLRAYVYNGVRAVYDKIELQELIVISEQRLAYHQGRKLPNTYQELRQLISEQRQGLAQTERALAAHVTASGGGGDTSGGDWEGGSMVQMAEMPPGSGAEP
jgi:hypothetical protein